MSSLKLSWDIGTCYDFYMSLHGLYSPNKIGLRSKWAAGVRSRLPADDREILQQARGFLFKVQHWLYQLPAPKDAATLLQALTVLSPEDRIPTILYSPEMPQKLIEIVEDVAARGAWSEADRDALPPYWGPLGDFVLSIEGKGYLLEWNAHRAEYGERYLQAMQTFHDVFFAEEEQRIWPMLQSGLEKAQTLAQQLSFPELLEELSQGVQVKDRFDMPELVLAPSFWSTPLITEGWINKTRRIILFGAKPPDASLVPGEVVPDALYLALKALADPTRLRILRYLTSEPQSPAQLARSLRLRAPTVIHHLQALRLAGLVHITLDDNSQRRYAARELAVSAVMESLSAFLTPD